MKFLNIDPEFHSIFLFFASLIIHKNINIDRNFDKDRPILKEYKEILLCSISSRQFTILNKNNYHLNQFLNSM